MVHDSIGSALGEPGMWITLCPVHRKCYAHRQVSPLRSVPNASVLQSDGAIHQAALVGDSLLRILQD